ncbi:MAG: tRNA (N(6)-L-threonylcarbamoyladenosine(37)-C(2))-methylthiotransferase MtaB [Chloroflexota bacterium]|nr:tRNA (N(6)-L-threonylcarbamoyladenosine(37)-C(2))-methylthiotransferase MtaB [Chloroflexota bacterium]
MKVHLRMVGCRLNQSEIDTMARQFQGMGHEVVERPEDADHFVLNTCAVTREAGKTSRKLVREFHRSNPGAETTVTGCYAQIAPKELEALPGIARVISNADKDNLASIVTGEEIKVFDHEPIERKPPARSPSRTRAFVKAQDGCDNECTFCVTTIARGPGRSRAIDELLREVNTLRQLGYQEAVLTGVHLGSYGQDQGHLDGLAQLVQALLRHSDMPRLRLSSLEPWDLAPGFFELWQDPRLCRHLHLPLQSGCDATLKRMRRNSNQAAFRALMQAAREAIPEARVTTDVIAGFPGETEEEFATSRAFIEEMGFDGLHVFRYSSRPGTPASRMKNQVSSQVMKDRSAELLAMSDSMEKNFAARLAGTRQHVLWEQITAATPEGFLHSGYTDNYMRVQAVHPSDLSNRICATDLGEFTDGVIHGTVRL